MTDPGMNSELSTDEKAWIGEFVQDLSSEEARIAGRLKRDHRGIFLGVALKELDLHETFGAKNGVHDDLARPFYIVSMGLRRLAVLMLHLHTDFSFPAITMPRSEPLAKAVLDIAAELGFIEHGRRIVDTVWSGLAKIRKIDNGRFRFELPVKLVDAQAHERSVEDHYRHAAREQFYREAFETTSGRTAMSTIQDSIFENVYVWRDQFMGYNADPLLDDAFFSLAWQHIGETPQYDSFNELKMFGGIPYLKYLMAAAIVISFALKHERFAATFVIKYPDMKRGNALTISADRESFIDSLWQAMDEFGAHFAHYTPTSREEAEQLFETIALTRSNIALAVRPHAPLPVVVEFASSSIVKLVCGRARQMEFLLDSLKSRYPRDYSTNQRSREASLQRALTAFFAEHFPGAICRTNVKLRQGGRVLTDVDLVVYDPQYGDLMLLQLKHQDCHGPDIKAANSRMPRFLHECVTWIAVATAWVERADLTTLRNAFRLPRNATVTRIRKLIVARHHAYPLAGAAIGEDVAYATWMQLYNAGNVMVARQGDFRTINGLFSLLRENVVGAPVRYHEDEEPMRFRLPGLEYEVIQQDAELSADE